VLFPTFKLNMSVLGFEVEWFDSVTGLMFPMFLKYFMENETIEILGDNKKAFLSRIYYPEVTFQDLSIGNSITVYNRLLTIKRAANTATEAYMKSREVRYIIVYSPKAMGKVSKVLDLAKGYNLRPGRVCTASFSSQVPVSFAMSVETGSCVMEIIGITEKVPEAFLKEVNSMDLVHGASLSYDKITSFLEEVNKGIEVPANSTLCLVKPHVLRNKQLGQLLDSIIDEGFKVTAISSMHMTISMAEELFEDYRPILKSYHLHLESLVSAPVVAIMLTGSDSIVYNFREFVGPQNPSLAKTLRPTSIRAIYGEDPVKNAVHCTDLDDEGEMECTYFFKTLPAM
jgi:nucleoside-diphosphate kinase